MDLPQATGRHYLASPAAPGARLACASRIPAGALILHCRWRSSNRGTQALSSAHICIIRGDFLSSVDILLLTYNRLSSLIMMLQGVTAQSVRVLRVIVTVHSGEP